ncbi:hypothetical protein ACJ41O_006143 [Fusarium nematophilum]
MPKAKSVQQARGKPRGIRRDRDCRSCKLRGVKCDLNRPRCLPCVESGLACGGYPQRVVWAGEPASASCSASAKAKASVPNVSRKGDNDADFHDSAQQPILPSAGVLVARPKEQDDAADGLDRAVLVEQDPTTDRYNLVARLLAFCRRLKTAGLSPGTHADDWQSLSVDQALGLVSRVDEFLQARIKTRTPAPFAPSPPPSSSHADDTPSPHSSAESDTFELHRLAALASLSEALKTADPVAFLGIAVFAFFEVVSDGSFGEWQCHLRGARSLLDYHCRSSNELDMLSRRVTGLAEMIAYFGWWDVVGSLLRKCSGGRISPDDRLIFDDWHRGILGDDFFNTVGCPSDVFWLFVSLAKGGDEGTLGPYEADQERCMRAMSQLLKLGLDTSDRGRCFDTYRCAAAIAILTWQQPLDIEGVSSVDPRQAALASAVDRICQAVDTASPCSRFYIHMATPAFLAAILESFRGIRERVRNARRDGD